MSHFSLPNQLGPPAICDSCTSYASMTSNLATAPCAVNCPRLGGRTKKVWSSGACGRILATSKLCPAIPTNATINRSLNISVIKQDCLASDRQMPRFTLEEQHHY